MFRRRRTVRQLRSAVACLTAERDAAWRETAAQRDIIADLGRRLHAAQRGPLGDTVPQPRVRSLTPVEPFPPKWWTT